MSFAVIEVAAAPAVGLSWLLRGRAVERAQDRQATLSATAAPDGGHGVVGGAGRKARVGSSSWPEGDACGQLPPASPQPAGRGSSRPYRPGRRRHARPAQRPSLRRGCGRRVGAVSVPSAAVACPSRAIRSSERARYAEHERGRDAREAEPDPRPEGKPIARLIREGRGVRRKFLGRADGTIGPRGAARSACDVISLARRQLQVEVGVLQLSCDEPRHHLACRRWWRSRGRVAGDPVLGRVGHVEVAQVGVARAAGVDRLQVVARCRCSSSCRRCSATGPRTSRPAQATPAR